MLDDFPEFGGGLELGSRRPPTKWVAVDTAPPPKPKRRYKKVIKREAAAAAKAAVAAALAAETQTSPTSKRQLNKEELQELSKKALASTYQLAYQRIKLTKEPRDPNLKCLSRENEEGNVEYKLRLKDPKEGNPYRIQQLITQMKYRLAEGNGECFYYIGVEDDGYTKGLEGSELQASISTLHFMARALGATVQLVRHIPGAAGRTCALLRVRKETAQQVAFVDLRVAVSGGVDSGKSSLVAVLTHGSDGRPLLDNGRGSARMSVLRHKHELESGRTSSISQQVLGYDDEGRVLNYAGVSALTPAEICGQASRLLTVIDMGGHVRYLKTCLWGMTCLLPDYAVLCVCAVGGLGRMSKEHLAVAVALEIPVAVVLTKCDLVGAARLEAVLAEVRALLALALPGLRTEGAEEDESMEVVAPLVQTSEEASACAKAMCQMRACATLCERQIIRLPIFATSAVSGAGLQLLHDFFNELQPAMQLKEQQVQQHLHQSGSQQGFSDMVVPVAAPGTSSVQAVSLGSDVSCSPDAPVLFQVDQTFDLHHVGSVVCGTVVQGVIRVDQRLLLGPDEQGGFLPVVVTGMQRLHTPVAVVRAGQTAALALSQEPGGGLAGMYAGRIISSPQVCEVALGGGGGDRKSSAGAHKAPEAKEEDDIFAGLGAFDDDAQDGEDDGGDDDVFAGLDDFFSEQHNVDQQGQASRDDAALTDFGAVCNHTGGPGGDSIGFGSSQRRAGEPHDPGEAGRKLRQQPHQQHARQQAWPTSHDAGYQTHVVTTAGISPPAHGAGEDEDWHRACELATSPPVPSYLSLAASPPNTRKGAVLLDAALAQGTLWEFEAVVVLLGGRWPARGLLSGRWPPLREDNADASSSREDVALAGCSSGSCSDAELLPRHALNGAKHPAAGDSATLENGSVHTLVKGIKIPSAAAAVARAAGGRPGSAAAGEHMVVIHCGSVRQAAHVVWMQELEAQELLPDLDMRKYCGIRATAAILQHDCTASSIRTSGTSSVLGSSASSTAAWSTSNTSSSANSSDEAEGSPRARPAHREDLGCIVHISFRFNNRPEWLREGARLIIRDRSDGHIAGAGFVGAVTGAQM